MTGYSAIKSYYYYYYFKKKEGLKKEKTPLETPVVARGRRRQPRHRQCSGELGYTDADNIMTSQVGLNFKSGENETGFESKTSA